MTPEEAVKISEQDEIHINALVPDIKKPEKKKKLHFVKFKRYLRSVDWFGFVVVVVACVLFFAAGITGIIYAGISQHRKENARNQEMYKMLDVEFDACNAKCKENKLKTDIVSCPHYYGRYDNSFECYCKDEFERPVLLYRVNRGR